MIRQRGPQDAETGEAEVRTGLIGYLAVRPKSKEPFPLVRLLMFTFSVMTLFVVGAYYYEDEGMIDADAALESVGFKSTRLDYVDKCAGQWRPGELFGPCFGLEKSEKVEGGKEITSAEDCQQFCCELDKKCVTWQFQEKKGCLVGGPVRFGFELADTSNW